MKPKHQRLLFIGLSMAFLCAATLFTLRAFRENIVFFYTPSELAGASISPDTPVRIGGLVESGSVVRDGDDLTFRVTDGTASLTVYYRGMTPGLFREGQGAVVEGYLENSLHINASRVLTKHDEYYMPKEVADALKKSGRWKEAPSP